MTSMSLDAMPLLRAAAALAVVLVLVMGASWLLRRAGILTTAGGGAQGRLGVVAAKALDGRSRLVLVRRDGVEHLLAVTPTGVTLIETLPATVSYDAAGEMRC